MKPLVYLPGVERDLIDAARWFEEQGPGLGERFLSAFDLTCHRIPYFPEMYPSVHKNIRRVVMHDFHYSVYYRVMVESIEVVTVMAHPRDPATIMKRLR